MEISRKRICIGVTSEMMIDWTFDGVCKSHSSHCYVQKFRLALTFNSFLMSSQLNEQEEKEEASEQKNQLLLFS